MMAGGGAARRRRDRRLRAAWHHEQLSVKMAVAAALHHSAQRGAGPAGTDDGHRGREPNNAPRSQKPPLPGEHPGVLKEPEVQGLPVAPPRPGSGAAPGLALPSLAGASGEDMDASSLAVLLRLSLAAQKEEEKAAKAAEEKAMEVRTVGISPGGGVRGPRQGSTTFPPERISERIMEQNGGGVQGFLTRQGSAALSEQVLVSAVHAATAPVVEFMASAPAVHGVCSLSSRCTCTSR